MIAVELEREGVTVATVVLHKGKVTVRTADRTLEQQLSRFFHVPETLWEKGTRRIELPGSEAHFAARCRGLIRLGLRARLETTQDSRPKTQD
jgi:hypothetical protein